MDIVFLIARPRSGTTVFRDIINQSPLVSVMPEIFHSNYVETENFFFNHYRQMISAQPDLALPSEVNRNKVLTDYLKTLVGKFSGEKQINNSLLLTANYNSLHCLNTYWQNIFEPAYLLRLINQNGYKVIHLIRKNIFETLVSEERAKQTGIWHKTKDDKTNTASLAANKMIKLKLDNLITELRLREMEIDLIDRYLTSHMPNRTLTIYYEDLFQAANDSPSKEQLHRVSTFLEIPGDLKPITKFRKTRHTIEETISNFSDVKKALIGTTFEHMLS